jgi:rhodanese-related sulfurtransferase
MARRKSKRQKKQNNNMLIIGAVGIIIIGAILAAVFANPSATAGTETTSMPSEITVQEAHDYYQDGTIILDVRTPGEWVDGHIPDATLIPLEELPNRLSELPADEEIVVICRSGNRSAQARDILLGAGFESVTSVTGGMNQWSANGFPVVTGP